MKVFREKTPKKGASTKRKALLKINPLAALAVIGWDIPKRICPTACSSADDPALQREQG